MTPACPGWGGGVGKGFLANYGEQEASPGCLCWAGSEVRAVAAASAQPKGHLASCPFSPHSWAHLPPDLKLKEGEENSQIGNLCAWLHAGGLRASSRWWLKYGFTTSRFGSSFALILPSCVALGWLLPSLNFFPPL